MPSIDYEKNGVHLIVQISKLTPIKILYSKIYLTELENQTMKPKMTELENWKKKEVYSEEEDMGQMSISLRWVLSWKVKNGENITKARLCANNFEEVKDFPTDSPCCSRIGIHAILILIISNQWETKSIDIKTAFLQVNRSKERYTYVSQRKQTHQAFGNCENVSKT